jgi:hypothetical protein
MDEYTSSGQELEENKESAAEEDVTNRDVIDVDDTNKTNCADDAQEDHIPPTAPVEEKSKVPKAITYVFVCKHLPCDLSFPPVISSMSFLFALLPKRCRQVFVFVQQSISSYAKVNPEQGVSLSIPV